MNLPPNCKKVPDNTKNYKNLNRQKKNSEPQIACFSRRHLPEFHTGRLSSFIISQTHLQICRELTPYVYCRLFASKVSGEFWLSKDDSFCGNKEMKAVSIEKYADSAHREVYYQPEFSFEVVMQQAHEIARIKLPFLVLHVEFMDFHLEQNHKGHLRAVYSFKVLMSDHPNPEFENIDNTNKIGEVGCFIPPAVSSNFESEYPINFHCKSYWREFLTILREKEKNHRKERAISSENISGKVIGLYIGRFQPFHLGHLKVIQSALSQVDFLKIGIGSSQYQSSPQNPFSYLDRLQMITESLQENGIDEQRYRIYPIPDTHNAELWVKTVIETVGEFHLFFSNSAWTRELFQKHGFQLGPFQVFDFDKFNGSSIRNLMAENKPIAQLVPKAVDRYIRSLSAKKKISFFGKMEKNL